MTMVKPMRAMIPVFELRERRSRIALARITQDIDGKRDLLNAADHMLGAIASQMKTGADARFSGGARTVAELIDSEQHLRSLREAQARLSGMRREAEGEIRALETSRGVMARQWSRDESKRTHADARHRRMRSTQLARLTEAAEEER
jgi:hypothetical protein